MCHSNRDPVEEEEMAVESIAFREIVGRLPARLTLVELALWLESRRRDVNKVEVQDAVRRLKQGGLIRLNGEILEPTHAAIRASELLSGYP